MSYIRFANDSDVYLYRSVYGGYRLMVAMSTGVPLEGSEAPDDASGRFPRFAPLESPRAGAEYTLNTPQECIALLDVLKGEGLHVPDRVFPRLRFEIHLSSRQSTKPLRHKGYPNRRFFKIQKMFYKNEVVQ